MIRLVSLNIERSKHLELVRTFLLEQDPDVFCLQEVCEKDLPFLSGIFADTTYRFTPMLLHGSEEGLPVVGVAVFSRVADTRFDERYYFGTREDLPVHAETPDRGKTMNCALAIAEIEKDGEFFRVATTHFTWSAKGQANDLQRSNMQRLLEVVEHIDGFILCGDFNAPRGGEIFAMLAEKYRDNIPVEYKTSIDVNLHRAGHLPAEEMDKKMVDGLFSTPEYIAQDVRLHSGVSDHQAITATITKNMKLS